jgi:hypothetical protein
MSGPAQISLHEPNSDTCDISPTHNDCRKAEPGGSPAQVKVLAAAQTDPHVSIASRRARVIEQPGFGRGFLQRFHFTAGLERNLAFPSRWHAPGSIGGGSGGYGCGRIGVRGRRRDPNGSPHLTFDFVPRRSMFAGVMGTWRQLARPMRPFPRSFRANKHANGER